jgi:hypothetical protein
VTKRQTRRGIGPAIRYATVGVDGFSDTTRCESAPELKEDVAVKKKESKQRTTHKQPGLLAQIDSNLYTLAGYLAECVSTLRNNGVTTPNR